MIAQFQTTDATNSTIHKGVIIAGKRMWARRLCKEPKRCLKCQSLGTNHLAAACGSHNICGTCGKEHWTADCTEADCDKFWCASCKVDSHASWDRLCPTFIEVRKRAECADPEHTYRFFPGQEPWTWEQIIPNHGGNMGGWHNASMA